MLLFLGAPLFNAIATNKWSLNFINEKNYDAWIGYYGSITGGALTLGGVWWTIKDNNSQRHKDLAIQYKPVFDLNHITLEKDTTDSMLKLEFNIQNVGRGEAYNFKIECNKDLFNSEDEEENNCFKKNIILPGDITRTEFYIQIYDYDPRKNIIINGSDTRNILTYNIKITITYSNMFNDLYEQIVRLPVSYNKIENKCRINNSAISYELIEKYTSPFNKHY